MSEGILSFLALEAQGKWGPGKKAFQKLVYFLQSYGVPLHYKYSMYFYGPYSKRLAEDLDGLTFEGVLSYIPEGEETIVKPGPAVESIIEEEHEIISEYSSQIEFILERLSTKSALDLELLSTTHFIMTHGDLSDVSDCIQKVVGLKGDKFHEDQVVNGLIELQNLGMLDGIPLHGVGRNRDS